MRISPGVSTSGVDDGMRRGVSGAGAAERELFARIEPGS